MAIPTISLLDPRVSAKAFDAIKDIFPFNLEHSYAVLAAMAEHGVRLPLAMAFRRDPKEDKAFVNASLEKFFGHKKVLALADRNFAFSTKISLLGSTLLANTHKKYVQEASEFAEMAGIQMVPLPIEQALDHPDMLTFGPHFAFSTNVWHVGRFPKHPLYGSTGDKRSMGPKESYIDADPLELLRRAVARVPNGSFYAVLSTDEEPITAVSWKELQREFPGRVSWFNPVVIPREGPTLNFDWPKGQYYANIRELNENPLKFPGTVIGIHPKGKMPKYARTRVEL